MRRGILFAFVVAGVLCTGAVFAQQTASGIETSDPEGGLTCVCASEEGTNAEGCWGDLACAGAVQCSDSSDCAANETCWRGDNCCGVAICAVTCAATEVCPGPAGTCGTFTLCQAGVPSMGQWGLGSLAVVLLLGALTLVLSRKGFSTPSAFILLVFALSLGAYSVGSINDTLNACEPASEAELASLLFLDE